MMMSAEHFADLSLEAVNRGNEAIRNNRGVFRQGNDFAVAQVYATLAQTAAFSALLDILERGK